MYIKEQPKVQISYTVQSESIDTCVGTLPTYTMQHIQGVPGVQALSGIKEYLIGESRRSYLESLDKGVGTPDIEGVVWSFVGTQSACVETVCNKDTA